MRLAVLGDLVGEGLEAPALGLHDLSAIVAEYLGSVFRECIHLGLGQVLTRKENMVGACGPRPVSASMLASTCCQCGSPALPDHPHRSAHWIWSKGIGNRESSIRSWTNLPDSRPRVASDRTHCDFVPDSDHMTRTALASSSRSEISSAYSRCAGIRSSIHTEWPAATSAVETRAANPADSRAYEMKTSPMVRWRESVANMAEAGVEDFVEIGGKVLGPMVKRIVPDVKVTSVVTIDDVEALAKEIA